MKLTKNELRFLIMIVLSIIAFNVIAFVVPFVKNGVFWIGYSFGMVAILLQIVIMKLAFNGAKSIRSKFYGFPIARIGVIYLFVQVLLSIGAMALGSIIPPWVPAVLFILILAAAAAGLVSADAVRDEIERQDKKIVKDVTRMRSLQSKINVIISQSDVSGELKAALDKLADEITYSDPVSNSATELIEDELNVNIDELQKTIVDGDEKSALTICKRTNGILAERNRLCKLNKNLK